MNRNRHLTLGILAAAALACGVGGIAAAQTSTASSSSSTSTTAHARHWRGARHSMLVGILLRASRQLSLTDAQKSDIKNLLMQARSSSAAAGNRPDMTVLGNPGDANFSTAVSSMKSAQAARLDRESALAQSIYQVLTPEQQKALPGVLTQMQQKFQARRAAWQQRQAPSSSSGN